MPSGNEDARNNFVRAVRLAEAREQLHQGNKKVERKTDGPPERRLEGKGRPPSRELQEKILFERTATRSAFERGPPERKPC